MPLQLLLFDGLDFYDKQCVSYFWNLFFLGRDRLLLCEFVDCSFRRRRSLKSILFKKGKVRGNKQEQEKHNMRN